MTATTQRLRIGRTVFAYTVDGAEQRADVAEIFIDECPLTQWLGIARDLGNADTDLEIPRPTALAERGLAVFLGQQPAHNQLGSARLVLYRCHCGCDYCGVVSCVLEVREDRVAWRQVAPEYEPGFAPTADAASVGPLDFVFDRGQYQRELERHFSASRPAR